MWRNRPLQTRLPLNAQKNRAEGLRRCNAYWDHHPEEEKQPALTEVKESAEE